jgi:molecular chaperone DnaJ
VAIASDDYYEILGIKRDANEAEIKSAYKKAARKYHPDNKETGNEEDFKKVGEAYEVLKDPQKRAIYDRYGAAGLKGMGGGAGHGFGDFSGFSSSGGFEDLSDIFSSFFGGGFSQGGRKSRSRAPERGQDHRIDIAIDFLDPTKELKKKLKINPLILCSDCNGKGALNPEKDISTCPTCDGNGEVASVQNSIFGQIRQVHTCPNCHGSGKIIKNPCKSCHGNGRKREEKEVEINIPAGVYDGAQMRLAGLGDAGSNGANPGDIYLIIHVNPHPKFYRDGAEVFSEITIGFAEASLGAKLKIPTVWGEAEAEVKSGTQSGDVLILKEQGMPKLKNPARRGDHHIKVNINIPRNLSHEERKVLEEFSKLRAGKDIRL